MQHVVTCLHRAGGSCLGPLVRLWAGQDARQQFNTIWCLVGVPALAIGAFLWGWHSAAARIHTSLGTVPGPVQVWHEARALLDDHSAEPGAVACSTS